MVKAYGYVRVSTAQQVDEGHSLAAQQQAIKDYCKRVMPDVPLAGIYVDRLAIKGQKKGCSGRTTFKDRPAGGQLAAALQKGDHVVMLDMARGFRKLVDAVTTMEEWREMGVALHLIRDSIDTTRPSSRLLVSILAVVAQWERDMASERTREVLAYRKERGEVVGGQPGYGYRYEGKKGERKKVADPAEMAVIERIHALSQGGMTYKDIYFLFLSEGVRTKKGLKWSKNRIWRAHRDYTARSSLTATASP